jgi:hypothetical protein
MATIAQLTAKIAQFFTASDKAHSIINGADNETVSTEAGNLPTIAKALKDFEDKSVRGDIAQSNGSGWMAQALANLGLPSLNNWAASTDPSISDDSGDGYSVGSVWCNTTTKEIYRCVDSTLGAAVWALTSLDIVELVDIIATYEFLTQASLDSGPSITNPTIIGFVEAVVANGNSGTAKTLSLNTGTFQTCTLNGNCTFTMPTPTAGQSFILKLLTGAGSFTAAFTGVKWPGGTAPTITAAASKYDLLSFVADGTSWSGSIIQNFTV